MFLLVFIILIGFLTYTFNFYYASVIIIVFFIFSSFFNKRKVYYIDIILATILSFGSVHIRYQTNISSDTYSGGLIVASKSHPQGNKYIGTGHIQEKYNSQTYVFVDSIGQKYQLRSTRVYTNQDIIRLNANYKPAILRKINSYLDFSLEYSFDYSMRLYMKGFAGILYEEQSIILHDSRGLDFLEKVKTTAQQHIIDIYGLSDYTALLLGMLIGDKTIMSKQSYNMFIDSSLVHIIVVSGGNIMMVMIFLNLIFFFLPYYIRLFVILIGIFLYAIICGLDSTVLRALLMGSLGIVALFRGREIPIWKLLRIVFVSMLIYNPLFLLYDIGFLFSFGAVIGLVKFSKKFHIKQTYNTNIIKNGLIYIYNNYILPTIGATAGVFPFIIFFMGKISFLGIITNIIVIPWTPVVLLLGVLGSVFYRIPFIVQIEIFLLKSVFWFAQYTVQNNVVFVIDNIYIKYYILILTSILYIIYINKSGKSNST